MLELLLSKYADATPKDIFGKTPLHMAAASGSMECVKALVHAAPLHISDTDDTNTIPLHEAAMGGFRSVLNYRNDEEFFRLGYDVIAMPTLHKINALCVYSPFLDIVKNLTLSIIRNYFYIYPHVSCSNICQYLLRRGADITSKDSNRWTALHHAAGSGHVSIVDALLNCSTASSSQIIDMEDSDGNTPLIVASKKGNLEVVRLLIKQKADISVRNRQSSTCLDVAVENGRELVAMEIVKSERLL